MDRVLQGTIYIYNQPLKGNPKVLEITNNYEELSLPTLKSEIEKAVKSLKKGKSPGNELPNVRIPRNVCV